MVVHYFTNIYHGSPLFRESHIILHSTMGISQRRIITSAED